MADKWEILKTGPCPGRVGIIFTSADDENPLIVLPGDNYLDTLERMGIDPDEMFKAGGDLFGLNLDGVMVNAPNLKDPVSKGFLAAAIAKAVIAGLLTERCKPKRYATKATFDRFVF